VKVIHLSIFRPVVYCAVAVQILSPCAFAAKSSNAAAPLARGKDGAVIDANKVAVTEKASRADLNMNALHRLDFKVKGKSCAVCLMKIQTRLKTTGGVAKVGVMLKNPYGAVIIYDSSKLNVDKLLVIAKGDEKEVSFDEVTDEPIKSIPIVVVPKFNQATP